MLTFINWQPYRYWKHKKLSPLMWGWLLDPNSMTQKLGLTCSKVDIEVIRQDWSLMSANKAKKIGFKETGATMVREVRIVCDDLVWMYAGTFISQKNLQRIGSAFKRLDTRPLGELLFKDQCWQRTQLDLAPIKSGQYPFEFLTTSLKNQPLLWGRRSYFNNYDKELMLIEVFTTQMWTSLSTKLNKNDY